MSEGSAGDARGNTNPTGFATHRFSRFIAKPALSCKAVYRWLPGYPFAVDQMQALLLARIEEAVFVNHAASDATCDANSLPYAYGDPEDSHNAHGDGLRTGCHPVARDG